MFHKIGQDKKKEFLNNAKIAREERAGEKKKESQIICIQKLVRGFLVRSRLQQDINAEFDGLFSKYDLESENSTELPDAESVHIVIRRFMAFSNHNIDTRYLEKICHYIIKSISSAELTKSYLSVALNRNYAVQWIQLIKSILWHCCMNLKNIKPENLSEQKSLMLYLHTLVIFNSTKSWKILDSSKHENLKPVMIQLCNNIQAHLVQKGLFLYLKSVLLNGLARSKPCLKKANLVAIMALALRPVIVSQFSEKLMNLYILHILSVPALIHHLKSTAPECIQNISHQNILSHSLDVLSSEQNAKIIFNSLEGSYALCLLANLIQLAEDNLEMLKDNTLKFTHVLIIFLESCQKYVVTKQSNLTQWHPVLGWFSQNIDQSLRESMPFVKDQIPILWSTPIINVLFSSLIDSTSYNHSSENAFPNQPIKSPSKSTTGILKKAFEKASARTSSPLSSSSKYRKLGSPETMSVSIVCSLYEHALQTLSQFKLDILAGLCYNNNRLLPSLWIFIKSHGPNSGVKSFLDHIANNVKHTAPEFQMLMLFCDCATHLITILDDIELYDKQKPFSVDDLIGISTFLNQFVFKIIWTHLIDLKTCLNNRLLASVHSFLMLLYQRDCRRQYSSHSHWLIKEIKVSSFMSDLDKGKRTAQLLLQKVPHVIPHKERVILFRKYVFNEKTVLGLTESACASPQSTLITINRGRIVEDGYQQLAQVSPQALKGVIRVKFVNEQGLDEAGIDQDGVFKEFLEETITRVFNPALNLFMVTSDQRLYPSPSSYVQDNHLAMFEFVGRMLGKAVYEGIVVDAPFASFFLSQVLGNQSNNALYSSIDELPSLDYELYKNLTSLKHYEGDVEVMSLTFSCNEDNMGQLVTHELIPGGKAIPVTNQNKINYIYLMAHFRMNVQIREQTKAFIRGFRSIVSQDWLMMFSTPELQRLISGDTSGIDLEDLRRHTMYYGGFHNNHRVICWLWEILDKDFTTEERSLFLKFVTSCSKPPLLGFTHLEPSFSIRCVEVSDDQDTGDTVASVIRGFFTVNRKDPVTRLPTSSTCFNLLKLPNYQKKGTLRDKLRYAITSNTGFELS